MRKPSKLHAWLAVPLLLAATVAVGEEPAKAEPKAEPKVEAKTDKKEAPEQTGPKVISGMSILGNQEAPKSLVIVPWKTSELGDSLGITALLDDSRQPIDRDVFLRALTYYEIRSEKTP